MVKNLPANAELVGSIPGLGRSPGEGNDNPLQYFLPGKSHGQRSLVGYSPWRHRRVRHNLATKQQQQGTSWYFLPLGREVRVQVLFSEIAKSSFKS